MSSERGGPVPVEALDVFSNMQKRIGMEERRPRVTKASDIMGPAMGPNAIVLESLDDDIGTFNGMWIVGPGAVGSPDDLKWWAGMTVANRENGGFQYASTFRAADAPLVQMVRGWSVIPGTGTRVYTPWQPAGGGGGTSMEWVTISLEGGDFTIPNGLSSSTSIGFDGTVDGSLPWNVPMSRFDVDADTAGVYEVTVNIAWRGNSSGSRYLTIFRNGTEEINQSRAAPPTSGVYTHSLTSRPIVLEDGDVMTIEASQSSGGGLGIVGTTLYLSMATIKKIG